jgi:hypothetical protein
MVSSTLTGNQSILAMRIALLTLASALFTFHAQAQWTQLTEEGYSVYEAYNSVIKFHPTSYEPYVMFQDLEINVSSVIKMRRFDGTAWQVVGAETLEDLILTNDHVAFEFDPINANVPIAYFHTGYEAGVVSQNGDAWLPYLGLDNYNIDSDIGFDFDLDELGNPTLAYGSPECVIPDLNITGPLNVLIHNSQEWGYLVAPCQSAMPATTPSLEYNDFDGQLMVFHSGGPDPDEDYIGEKWLLEYNVSTTEPVAIPEFISESSIGQMTTNPVNGETYVYSIEPPTVGSPDRVLTLLKWNGTELSTINTDDILIKQASAFLKVHPITGEIYVVYRDADLNTGFEFEWNVKRLENGSWVAPFSSLEPLENFEVTDFAFHPVSGDIAIAIQRFIDGPLRGAVITHEQTSNVSSIQNEIRLNLYPNPASNSLSVDLSGFTGPVAIEVRAMDGRFLKDQSQPHSENMSIDTKDLKAGSYILTCKYEFGEIQSRFMVH